MKMKIILVVGLISVLGCQTFFKSKNGEGPKAEYSEAHLDFKGWGRDSNCCSAVGVKAAVASGGTNSSKAGLEILKAGGNVVDAAIATAFVLAVERPHSAGLGGGGFMTLHLKDNDPKAHFIDFRETAPEKAHRDMYLDKNGNVIADLSVIGPLSVATPGFVIGLFEIHKKWGKLPWNRLLIPSIELASNGFKIYTSLANHILEKKDCLVRDLQAQKLLFNDGKPRKVGEVLVQKDLANTLRRIAKNGAKEFQTGKTAKAIANYMKANSGILSERDLKNYQIKSRNPIVGTFKDWGLISAPPPSAGGVLILQMLKVLEGFPLEELSQKTPQYSHLLSEVLKRAYADRSQFVGDPDFVSLDYSKLTDQPYIEALRGHVFLDKATPSSEIQGGQWMEDKTHTTHLSVVDTQGNAVASTLTINDIFGACVIAPGTGIFLNDEMDDFSAKPGASNIYGLTGDKANEIQPGKRPASSMSPTIITQKGQPILVVGAAGGSRITTSVFQVILNDLFVFKGDLKKSVFGPRIHQQWMPEFLDLEESYSEATKQYLSSIGEKVRKAPWSAVTQAAHIESDGRVRAVFDPRDEGGAEAY
jgi:gamma-glutamyltranspeptidase/glutathione hydrolase